VSTTDSGASEPSATGAPRSPRFGGVAKTVAPVVVALVAGGGIVFALEHHSGSASAAGATPAVNGGGGLSGAGGNGNGFGGGVAGEQHILGTVAATGAATITVKTGSGSATYVVNATTEIVRNGQSATLSEIQVGDPVLVHVYPSSSGQMLVERLLAGTSANDGPGGFGPPSGQRFGNGAGGPTT